MTTQLRLEHFEERALPASLSLTGTTIAENQYVGYLVGNFNSSIPLGIGYTSYQLVSGAGDTNNNNFFIAGDQLRTAQMFDFETTTSQSIRVRAQASNGQFVENNFNLSITNVNEPPTNLALSNTSVNENSAAGTLVGLLSSVDPDAGDTTTYVLTTNPGNRFQINGDRLEVAAGANLNFEGQQNFYVSVRAVDALGAYTERGFSINVLNVNEPPTNTGLVGDTVQEGSPAGAYIGTLVTYDEDGGPITYVLTDDAGGRFAISGSSLVVGNPSLIDFETATSHSITVRAIDNGGLYHDATFTIHVTNRNEAPTDIVLDNASVSLPASAGALVGNLSASDPDAGATFNYILVNNAGGKFQISGNQLRITNTELFLYDLHPTYDVTVMVQDQGGMSYQETFTISVSYTPPANQAPTNITLTSNSIPENSPNGQFVGYVSAVDPDSYVAPVISLQDDAGGRFAMSGNNLVVANGALLNYEANSSHQVTIRATDAQGAYTDQNFTIQVTNVNEAPTDILLDNTDLPFPSLANDYVVGTFTALDPDLGDSAQFILTNNAGGKFKVVGNQLRVANRDLFLWDLRSSYEIRVIVLDGSGLPFDKSFTINFNV